MTVNYCFFLLCRQFSHVRWTWGCSS